MGSIRGAKSLFLHFPLSFQREGIQEGEVVLIKEWLGLKPPNPSAFFIFSFPPEPALKEERLGGSD